MSEPEVRYPTAGRELDALVVEKVMGLVTEGWPHICSVEGHETDDGIWCYVCNCGVEDAPLVPPMYSTSIADAWLVVDKVFRDNGYTLAPLANGWGVYEGDDWFEVARADTAPLAICLAALKAVEASHE